MLNEQEIEKIRVRYFDETAITSWNQHTESHLKVAEAQHKADLVDFQKQKQEMWKELCEHLENNDEDITDLESLKQKWGIV